MFNGAVAAIWALFKRSGEKRSDQETRVWRKATGAKAHVLVKSAAAIESSIEEVAANTRAVADRALAAATPVVEIETLPYVVNQFTSEGERFRPAAYLSVYVSNQGRKLFIRDVCLVCEGGIVEDFPIHIAIAPKGWQGTNHDYAPLDVGEGRVYVTKTLTADDLVRHRPSLMARHVEVRGQCGYIKRAELKESLAEVLMLKL